MALPTVLPAADLHHPAVDAALAAAAEMTGMRAVFVGGLSGEQFVFERFWGNWPGIAEGDARPRTDSFCHRLLAGAAPVTADAARDPSYADAPARTAYGIMSYAGVPLGAAGPDAQATFCGIDGGSVPVSEESYAALRALASVVGAFLRPAAPTIRRTSAGWRVAGTDEDDLLSAMVLADLLAPPVPDGRAQSPEPAPDGASETERLQATVRQLEHALSTRVVVEQAIGVLSERQRIAPRAGFERLRRAARSRGRRVVDLAREVVASTVDPAVPLPPELAGRRS